MNNTAKDEIENGAKDLIARMRLLEQQVSGLYARNQRVESNKAWEMSKTRLISVTLVTYVTMILIFSVLDSRRPVLDALVPTAGFFLSTLSLPLVRRLWKARTQRRWTGRD